MRIREDIVLRVELELWSHVEGRVPYGAWGALVGRLLEEHLNKIGAEKIKGAPDGNLG